MQIKLVSESQDMLTAAHGCSSLTEPMAAAAATAALSS